MDRPDETEQSLQAENERLRKRVAELERATGEAGRLFETIVESAPIFLYAKDLAGRYVFVNRTSERIMGMSREQILGKTDYDFLPKEDADYYVAGDRKALETGEPLTREDTLMLGGQPTHWVTTKFPLRDAEGRAFAACSMTVEVTPLARAREEYRKLQEEIIRVQEESLRALSTPLMPIAAGVLVMPLVGAIDRSRAELVLSTLLSGITEHRASVVIIDITGVPVVDAAIASALARAAQAVKLLGAEAVLTGVRPQIAQTLVTLGIELTGIKLKSTLQSGVAYALGRRA
jgi:PAS domain S-box-containing protein